MTILQRGLLLAGLHAALICTLGAKLIYDRAHRPRVWMKVAPVDPDLPIRGRYLSIQPEVPARGFSVHDVPSPYLKDKDGKPVPYSVTEPNRGNLELREGHLVAIANADGEFAVNAHRQGENFVAVVAAQSAYFLPEHAKDPSHLAPGEELWMEATIPHEGPPRPIRLAVKKDGKFNPLNVE